MCIIGTYSKYEMFVLVTCLVLLSSLLSCKTVTPSTHKEHLSKKYPLAQKTPPAQRVPLHKIYHPMSVIWVFYLLVSHTSKYSSAQFHREKLKLVTSHGDRKLGLQGTAFLGFAPRHIYRSSGICMGEDQLPMSRSSSGPSIC